MWKIRTIFQKFCNTDGFLGYEDFKKLDNETEEEGSILDPEMFVQLCNFLCVADVTKGLSFVEYASIYLNETASETLESDLNADFATLFPDYSKVAMIFDAFDADADGVLNAVEFERFFFSVSEFEVGQKKKQENGTKAKNVPGYREISVFY